MHFNEFKYRGIIEITRFDIRTDEIHSYCIKLFRTRLIDLHKKKEFKKGKKKLAHIRTLVRRD